MAEAKTYTGGCHCGAVRYEVETDLAKVMSCNCSICSKAGTMLTFVPATKFTLQQGEGSLKDYLFNRNVIHHLFCTGCGIKSFARGSDRQGNAIVAINVRCLDGVELESLTVSQVDGKSF